MLKESSLLRAECVSKFLAIGLHVQVDACYASFLLLIFNIRNLSSCHIPLDIHGLKIAYLSHLGSIVKLLINLLELQAKEQLKPFSLLKIN